MRTDFDTCTASDAFAIVCLAFITFCNSICGTGLCAQPAVYTQGFVCMWSSLTRSLGVPYAEHSGNEAQFAHEAGRWMRKLFQDNFCWTAALHLAPDRSSELFSLSLISHIRTSRCNRVFCRAIGMFPDKRPAGNDSESAAYQHLSKFA